MTIIAVGNQKGGVGKTNTVVNLGHGLAMRGHNVLLIDMDSQGHVAVCLGLEKGSDLAELLLNGKPLNRVAVKSTGRERLHVVRSDSSTAALKEALTVRRSGERALKKALAGHGYDVVLLDCAPSKDILQDNALLAADYLLIPIKLQQLAADGLGEIMSTMVELQEEGSTCKLAGVLPTFLDQRENETFIQLENLARSFGDLVYSPVAIDARVPVINRIGKTLWEQPRRSRALDGYEKALDRLERLLK